MSRPKLLAAALALLPFSSSPSWQDETAKPAAGPVVGKPAPAFRLNDELGKAVAVGGATLDRWTVLAFYPKALTPG